MKRIANRQKSPQKNDSNQKIAAIGAALGVSAGTMVLYGKTTGFFAAGSAQGFGMMGGSLFLLGMLAAYIHFRDSKEVISIEFRRK